MPNRLEPVHAVEVIDAESSAPYAKPGFSQLAKQGKLTRHEPGGHARVARGRQIPPASTERLEQVGPWTRSRKHCCPSSAQGGLISRIELVTARTTSPGHGTAGARFFPNCARLFRGGSNQLINLLFAIFYISLSVHRIKDGGVRPPWSRIPLGFVPTSVSADP